MIKTVRTGKCRVIDSGSVILVDGNSTAIFTLDVSNGFVVTVEIAFATEADSERSIKKEVDVQKNYLKFTCINFDNSLGTGTTNPLDIATVNNKQVSMNIWAYMMGNREECIRKVDYSFYIEE